MSIALGVLDALAAAPELSLSELARRVGVAKSTAHRTCAVLTAAGLLTRTPAGKYRLGLRLIEYGHLATARSPVGEHGLPLLVELRAALGETVQIGVPAGADVVYVERVEGVRALRYSTATTRGVVRSTVRAPARCWRPSCRVCSRRGSRPGCRRAPATRSSCPTCSAPRSTRSASAGYARSVDETEIGMSSLAVPVRSAPSGPVVAAISMVGPTSRVAGDTESSNVAALQAAARKLTEALELGDYRLPRRRR